MRRGASGKETFSKGCAYSVTTFLVVYYLDYVITNPREGFLSNTDCLRNRTE